MMRFDRPQRVWINQPSGLQEYHALHGKRAIAVAEKYDAPDCPFVTVYFTEGAVESMRIAKLALSPVVGECAVSGVPACFSENVPDLANGSAIQ